MMKYISNRNSSFRSISPIIYMCYCNTKKVIDKMYSNAEL